MLQKAKSLDFEIAPNFMIVLSCTIKKANNISEIFLKFYDDCANIAAKNLSIPIT